MPPSIATRAFFFTITALALLASSAATAADRACLLEADHDIAGTRLFIKDCAENRTMGDAEFREACGWMGNPLGDERYKAKTTWSASCPSGAQAQCEGAMGGQMDFHYYERDAALLETSKTSCASLGGSWSAD